MFDKLFFQPDLKLAHAKSSTHENLISWEVEDQYGNEIFTVGSELVGTESAELAYQQMCWIMCMVNESNKVKVNGSEIEIEWRGKAWRG